MESSVKARWIQGRYIVDIAATSKHEQATKLASTYVVPKAFKSASFKFYPETCKCDKSCSPMLLIPTTISRVTALLPRRPNLSHAIACRRNMNNFFLIKKNSSRNRGNARIWYQRTFWFTSLVPENDEICFKKPFFEFLNVRAYWAYREAYRNIHNCEIKTYDIFLRSIVCICVIDDLDELNQWHEKATMLFKTCQ